MTNRRWLGRREFVGAAAVVLARPRVVFASDHDNVFRLAVVIRPGQESDLKEPRAPYWRTWYDELRQLGYVEGQNLEIEIHLADPSSLDQTIADLSAFRPDAVFVPAQSIVSLLKKAKVSTPIVTVVVRPVAYGLAESLARPGGNITGFTLDAGLEIIAKRVSLLREIVPSASRLVVLVLRPYWEAGRTRGDFLQVGEQLGITIIGAPVESQNSEKGYQQIFADAVRAGGDSLYVTPAPENLAHRGLIADLAIEARLPSVSQFREYVEAGGLIGYGPDIVDVYRRAAGYLDRIFKGADPAGMPYQQPTKFDLTLNLKTAKALGLAVPPSLLALADDVFE